MTYRIVRFFQTGEPRRVELHTVETLEEAQEHCNDPETSSRTATGEEAQRRTSERGAWFDGYEEE